jgi:hypothetical protein
MTVVLGQSNIPIFKSQKMRLTGIPETSRVKRLVSSKEVYYVALICQRSRAFNSGLGTKSFFQNVVRKLLLLT